MSFISKIQNSDEATKKKWVAGLSALTMVIVIGGWLVYMNNTLGGEQAGKVEKIGFWQVFKTGLKVTGESLKENAGKLSSIFKGGLSQLGGTKNITIENP